MARGRSHKRFEFSIKRGGRLAAALVAALAAVLCGCRKPAASADAEAREARRQLRAGKFAEALAGAERGMRDWRDRPESPQYWRFRTLCAEALLYTGRTKEAWPLLEQDPPDKPELREFKIRTLMHRGYATNKLGDYAGALKLFDEAFQLVGTDDQNPLVAEVELRRGSTLAQLGDAAASQRSVRHALEVATRAGDDYLQAAALGNRGYSMMQLARWDEAIPNFEQSLALAEHVDAQAFVATNLGNLGRCYLRLGDFDRAARLLIRAVERARGTGDPRGLQLWLGNLGETYFAQADFAKAAGSFQQALEISRRIDDKYSIEMWLDDITMTAIESGDLTAAKRYNEEALALSRQEQNPDALVWPGLLTGDIAKREGDVAGAEKAFGDVLPIAVKSKMPEGVWQAHAGLAWVRTAQRRWGEAETEYRTALTELEQARVRLAREEWKLSFQSQSIQFYREYVRFLLERGQTEKALEVAEASRGRVLAGKLGILQSAVPAAAAGRYRALAVKLDTVLVSIWLASGRSVAWVVTPRKVEVVDLPPEAEINGLARAYKGAIQSLRDPLSTENPAGRQLWERVLAPLAQRIPPGKSVVLVPDGALHELNLEAVPVGLPRAHYWLEDVTLSIMPSLGLLAPDLRGKGSAPDSLLLIGDPVPPGTEYAALPDAGTEVANLRRRFAGSDHVVLRGAAAEPGAYRQSAPGRFTLIHFTAHATGNSESPLDSAVILSRKGEAYKLYAREVIGLPLRARLVTISACRGAGARVYSGEGLVGFAWAFLEAGAQNVIAGLWEVNDRSTAILMDRLYAGLKDGESPAAALRAAKLGLLNSAGAYRKPFYWAPFQVFTRWPGR